MAVPPRARIAAALTLAALFALLFLFPTGTWAGERKSSTTSSWSSTSSTKTSRTGARTPRSYGYSYRTDDDREGPAGVNAYVFSRADGHWTSGSGSDRDWRDAGDLRDRMDVESLLWFRRGDDQYVVTDRDLLERLAGAMKPQEELGRRQGELGRRQGELGRLQGELGRQQGKLGRMQAQLARRRAALSLRIAEQDDATEAAVERERREIAVQEDEISELQNEIGDQQSRLGERQGALGEQQSRLGEEQSRVSKEVERKLGELIREAMDRGLVKPVGR